MSTIERKRFKEILDDPVLWAKAFVKTFDPVIKKITPWVARWYQVEMLRDKSLRKVARCGRRTGKCLPGWVKVFDPTTGRRVPIEELYQNKKANILTMTKKHKIEKHDTSIVLDNGIKEVFRVKLESGREIDATGNHPLYTINGWEDIDNLKPGVKVATPRIMNYFGEKEIKDEKVVEIVEGLVQENKPIPEAVFELTESKLNLFIKELLKRSNLVTNEIYNKKETKICYRFGDVKLALDLQHLLLRFGLNSIICNGSNGASLSIIYGKENANDEIRWDEIVSIESIGMHQTYDLTVPHTHNFIANDIIVHNTEVMCIDSLHKTYTKPKFRVLFITPYENQVRLIFMRLRELIDMSPMLKQEVVKITSNPFQIVWKNGGAIMGFTTGASSGSGGASVRGQKADYKIS